MDYLVTLEMQNKALIDTLERILREANDTDYQSDPDLAGATLHQIATWAAQSLAWDTTIPDKIRVNRVEDDFNLVFNTLIKGI